MKISILYFAILADQAGKTEEMIEIDNPSINVLYEKLSQSYGFQLAFENIQVAINHEIGQKESALKDGDILAFLPPMAGG